MTTNGPNGDHDLRDPPTDAPNGDHDLRDPPTDAPNEDHDLRDPPTDAPNEDHDLRDPPTDALIDELRRANPVDPEELPSPEDPEAKTLLKEILKSGRGE